MVRQQEGRLPIEAVALAFRGPRTDRGLLAGAEVPSAHAAVLAFRIYQVGIVRIDGTDEAVTAADVDPVLIDGASLPAGAARSAPAAVILQTTVDVIVRPRVEGDVVELAQGDVVQVVPVRHAVVGDVEAAIAAD